jgi:hypothetical protein
LLKITCQLLFLGSPLLLVAAAQGFCIKYGLLRRLKKPLDMNLKFREKRVLGDNKTWRGLLLNLTFCTVGTMIQAGLQENGCVPVWLFLADYSQHGLAMGLLIGCGTTFGELPNSFLKRQMDIPPGKKGKGMGGIFFTILDQIDLTIGMWIFTFSLIRPAPVLVLWSLLLTLIIHMAVSSAGYLLGMRESII